LLIDLSDIRSHSDQHSPQSPYFTNQKKFHEELIGNQYLKNNTTFVLGQRQLEIEVPYIKLGKVSSSNLFTMNELILFAFYDLWVGLRYRKVLDLGANIGLHSIILSGFGADVTALEPDPFTFKTLQEIAALQKFKPTLDLRNAAVYVTDQESISFLRVTQNLTGSHLLGARKSMPFGGFEEISVRAISFKNLLEEKYDLVKMDVEGSEAELFESVDLRQFPSTDYLLEIGSAENALRIWKIIRAFGVNGFSQKRGWAKASVLTDLPTHHSEGSLFITNRDRMEW